jgi:hypothetical protein
MYTKSRLFHCLNCYSIYTFRWNILNDWLTRLNLFPPLVFADIGSITLDWITSKKATSYHKQGEYSQSFLWSLLQKLQNGKPSRMPQKVLWNSFLDCKFNTSKTILMKLLATNHIMIIWRSFYHITIIPWTLENRHLIIMLSSYVILWLSHDHSMILIQ